MLGRPATSSKFAHKEVDDATKVFEMNDDVSEGLYASGKSRRPCLSLDSFDYDVVERRMPGDELFICDEGRRYTMGEYVMLPRYVSQSVHGSRLYHTEALSSERDLHGIIKQNENGDVVDLVVTAVEDAVANASSCAPGAQSSTGCNYRSAVAYCQEFMTHPLDYCTIHLPELGLITMDPGLGDVKLEEVAGTFNLVSGMLKDSIRYLEL